MFPVVFPPERGKKKKKDKYETQKKIINNQNELESGGELFGAPSRTVRVVGDGGIQ
jgi:hypothetical protein